MRVAVGASLGILVTGLVCGAFGRPGEAWPWLIAPMGASAVLVFGVPASPLAQPWAVLGGNTLSALAGIVCVHLFASPELAAALAVGLAIAVMFAARCLHPPGGASALLVALNGVTDPQFALYPVLVNSLLLAAVGIAYNSATRRPYPHPQLPAAPPAAVHNASAEAIDAALDAALAHYNQVLDVSRDDLLALLEDTRLRGYQRQLSQLRCSDIMSRALITVGPATPLPQAWALFRAHRIKALPVVDGSGDIVGIVTPADFIKTQPTNAMGAAPTGAADRADLAEGKAGAQQPQVIAEIMTRKVRVASANRHLAELVPLFGGTGHHHIPIVDGNRRLVGIVTQSDVVAALSRPDMPRG